MERREQLAILLLALALWSIDPHASLWAPLAAYGLAWLAVNVVKVVRPRALRLSLTRGQAIALALVIAIPSVAQAFRLFDRVVEREALTAIDHATAARMRLDGTPSIAPPLVAADRPQTFYVHAPGARRVTVRFGSGARRLATDSLGHGLFRLAYDPRRDGAPHPADGELDATLEVDGSAHERAMLAVTPLAHPRWLAPSPDRRRAATVSEETDELFVVDDEGRSSRVAMDDGPSDARFLDEATIVVAHRYADTLAFVDVARGRVRRRAQVGPFGHRLAVHASETIALAQGGEHPQLSLLDRDGTTLARVAPGFVPDHLAFGPDADTLVVSSVRPPALHRFRREGRTLREESPPLWLGRPAVALGARPDGSEVVVAVTDYQPEGPPHLGNHYVQDRLLTVDVARWSIAHHRLTPRRTRRQESPGNVDRGVSPMGIDVLDDGAMIVAFAGTDDVWRIDPQEDEPTILGLDEHPVAAPFSAVMLASDRIAVSSPSYGTIGIFTREGERTGLVRFAPDDRTLLREDERALQRRIGERGFYESTRAGISCQSCHLHGGSDGQKHNIGGSTFVATLDARGQMGTPPYLRDGGYPLLASLLEVSDTLYRGYMRHQGGRRIGLERYLEAEPRPTPPRQLEGRDRARERRGLDAFVRARCPLCHAFPAFTNLGQHPMEALFPERVGEAGYELDTPSLFNLGESAPYLLDGSAETLEEVFRDHDRAHRHGDTASLSAREKDDLFHFLEGL